MRRDTRHLLVILVASLLAFSIATTVINTRSNARIERQVNSKVVETNAALCDLFRFSIVPGPTPPQPKVEPRSEFGQALAEYNRIQAIRQREGRAKVEAAIKRYC